MRALVVLGVALVAPVVSAAPPPPVTRDTGKASAAERRPAERVPWEVEASLGVPFLETEELELVGEAYVGYDGPRWGFEGEVSRDTYADGDSSEYSAVDELETEVAAWFIFGGEPRRWRLEVELAASYQEHTTSYESNDPELDGISETETLTFVGGLAGFRSPQGRPLLFRGLFGAGFEAETYDIEIDNDAVLLEGSFDPGFFPAYFWDLALTWRAWPGSVGFRLTSELEGYTVNHIGAFLDESLDIAPGDVIDTEQVQVLETENRLFIDLDFARFAFIQPHVYVGYDAIYKLSDDDEELGGVFEAGGGLGTAFDEPFD